MRCDETMELLEELAADPDEHVVDEEEALDRLLSAVVPAAAIGDRDLAWRILRRAQKLEELLDEDD